MSARKKKVACPLGAPMLKIGGSEPLDATMAAVRELAALPGSEALRLRAMEFVQALAKDASITANISDCSFESAEAGTCVLVSTKASLNVRDSSFNMGAVEKKRGAK